MKMEVEVSTTTGRNFRGTVGLEPGFEGNGEPFKRSDIIDAWKAWAKDRVANKQPFLGVIVGPIDDILYAFEEADGHVFRQEPIVSVYGEIASYHEHMTDDEIVESLKSLFTFLGQTTKQTTVRFIYWGKENFRCSYRLRLPNTLHPLDPK